MIKPADDMAPYGRSADGRFLTYRLNITNTGLLPLTGELKARPLLQATFTQTNSQPAPHGRWLAYASNESGVYEVFIRDFPGMGGKWQVSQGGGVFPRWRGDGKELYYYGAGERLMVVSIAGQTSVEIGSPVPLFETHMLNGPNIAVGFRAQ